MKSISGRSLMLPDLNPLQSQSFTARKFCIGCGEWSNTTEQHRNCCNPASGTAHLSQSPYFTRSAARLSEINSSSITLSNANPNYTVRLSVTSLSSKNSNSYAPITNSNQNLDCISGVPFTQNSVGNRRKRHVDLCNSRIDNILRLGNSELVSVEQYVRMDFPDHRPESCCSCRRWCFFFLMLACLLPASWYIHRHFAETQLFLHKVEVELCRLQEQMKHMKHNVEKGTQQQLETMGKDTKQKLEAVEKLLWEIKSSQNETEDTISCSNSSNADKDTQNEAIRVLVLQVLDEYDADKTGKTDFALESSGGSIISTGNTQPYEPEATSASLFGIPICCSANGPRAVIQANVYPGECWAFKGSSGSVVIKLLGYVFISGVSLEHISKSISPSGQIDSAPKEFSIWGRTSENSKDAEFFGRFSYDSNGPTVQYFDIDGGSQSYLFVELKVHSNHGNSYFTCVYRLRVHGTLDAAKSNHVGKQ